MNSIESLTVDYNSQISQLGKINNDKISDNLVFVGSGDSYVAALIAEYLTNHKCKCYSPSDLFNSGLAKDRTYCFISVTGKTKANISVAKRASETGSKTIAVTLDRNSKLAEVCTKVIPLKITKVNTPNAGFSTFVANVVTCLQIAGIDVPIKFDTWRDRAIEFSLKLLDTVKLPEERVHLLGNNMLYAVALYASFQLAEFFGTAAVSHKLEEFCHSPVFSLKKSENILIFGQNEKEYSSGLERLGLRSCYVELYNPDALAQVFQSIFLVQKLMLLLAEKYGYPELQYLLKKDILKVSSDIIYDG